MKGSKDTFKFHRDKKFANLTKPKQPEEEPAFIDCECGATVAIEDMPDHNSICDEKPEAEEDE